MPILIVMAGLDPAIQGARPIDVVVTEAWITGTSPVMTTVSRTPRP